MEIHLRLHICECFHVQSHRIRPLQLTACWFYRKKGLFPRLGLARLRIKNLGDFFVESRTSAVMVDGDASGSESCGSSSIFRILHFEWTASFLVRRAIGSVVGGIWGVGSGAG
ncbi:hypothetical protein ACLOJK_004726 [Asimina triloba]